MNKLVIAVLLLWTTEIYCQSGFLEKTFDIRGLDSMVVLNYYPEGEKTVVEKTVFDANDNIVEEHNIDTTGFQKSRYSKYFKYDSSNNLKESYQISSGSERMVLFDYDASEIHEKFFTIAGNDTILRKIYHKQISVNNQGDSIVLYRGEFMKKGDSFEAPFFHDSNPEDMDLSKYNVTYTLNKPSDRPYIILYKNYNSTDLIKGKFTYWYKRDIGKHVLSRVEVVKKIGNNNLRYTRRKVDSESQYTYSWRSDFDSHYNPIPRIQNKNQKYTEILIQKDSENNWVIKQCKIDDDIKIIRTRNLFYKQK